MKKYLSLILTLLTGSSVMAAVDTPLNIEINPQKTFQTIDHFTAADAWSGNFIGQYFEESQKGQLAKWLFSQKLGNDGNPEGIGLSMWRVNIGGGTLEQSGADIMPFQRRAESFLTKDGNNYDWAKAEGQQYFMRKAKEYGCDKFLLFSNTPPVQWTRNGKGYTEKTEFASNLKPDCYGKFADYMADVAKHFEAQGYNIAYISPVNEPQGDWNSNRQEGSAWRLSEIAKIVRELDKSIVKSSLKNTKILLGETINYASCIDGVNPQMWSTNYKKACPQEEWPINQIKAYFDKSSPYYLGDLPTLYKVWGAHAYGTGTKFNYAVECRQMLDKEAKKYGVGFLQTEWCWLPHHKPPMDGFTNDWKSDNFADIQSALCMARIISADLTIAQSQGWGYWKGMEIKGNHALTGVYLKDGDITHGGVARANKLLWALGNYSLFIRPDFKRIEILGADEYGKIQSSAFASPDGKRIVAVFVNSTFDKADANVKLDGLKIESVKMFRTDARMDLANCGDVNPQKIVLAPRSITTIVFDVKKL